MFRTAERSTSARGLFRDADVQAGGLFRSEEAPVGQREHYHVSAADDPEEISAERTADRVMGGGIFREADGPGLEGGEAELPSEDLAGPGSALPAGLQESMGASIGADFSGVRIHTDAGADRASRSISARAFAKGQDIYFRNGEYNPGSQEGQHIIAHELAHVADGVSGLHRVGPASAPATAQNNGAPTGQQAAAPELPAIPAPLPKDGTNPKEVDADKVETEMATFTQKASEADTLIEETGKLALENIGTKETALRDATTGLGSAKEYLSALTTYLGSKGIDRIDGAKKQKLETAKTNLENLKLEEKQTKVKGLLASVKSEQAVAGDAPLSESVKDMLNSPYFPQFLKAVGQLRAVGGDFAAAEEAAAKEVEGKASSTSAEEKRNYIAHQNELRHEENTGIDKAKDRSTWMKTTGTVLGAVGESANEVSESAGAIGSAAVTQKGYKKVEDNTSLDEDAQEKEKEKVDKEASEKGESIQGAMSASAEGLGAIGAGLNMAQNSKEAEAQRKQDAKAKQTMRGIAKQLRRTLPVQAPETPQGGGAQNDQERTHRMQAVCSRIEQSKFNDEKLPLIQLIQDAMDESPDVKPELKPEQKGWLSTLLALETSRGSSKEKASALRKEAIFSAMDMVSAAMKSAGGFVTSLGGNSVVGAILTLIGGVFGQIRAVHDKIAGGGEESGGEDENAKKLAASRAAIQQMAALPELTEQENLKKKAGGKTQTVSGQAMAVAEQYAAAFYTIEAANVNMSDILFAIEKGEFGKKTGPGANDKKSAGDSMKDMYVNLSFS